MFLINTLMEDISVGTAGLVALLGYAVVFIGLIALMAVIMIVGKIMVAKKTAPAAAPAAPAPAAPAGDGEKITSPMPGTILSVNVAPGQSVRKGDVLMVLEAMKMENEIMCPRDGVVSSVQAAKGAAVESGTLLCVLQ